MALAILAAGCSTSPQAKRDRYLKTGKEYLAKKDYDRAVLELKNAAQAMPRDPEAYYYLGEANLSLGDLGSAVGFFQKACELNPKHVQAQGKLAGIMATSRNEQVLTEAEARLKDILAITPGDPAALNTLAITEYRLGRHDAAEASLKQAMQKAPSNVQPFMTLAAIKLSTKDVQGAEDILKEASKASPNSALVYTGLGRLYLMLGRLPEAGTQFEKAVQAEPENAEALVDLGRYQSTTGQVDRAEATFRKLSNLTDPRFKPSYGEYLLARGRIDAATAEFQRLSQLDPKNRSYRTHLVWSYLAARNHGAAEALLTSALDKNPKDLDALLQRGEFYLRGGRIAKARADISEAVHGEPNDPRAHYLLAKLYQAEGNDVLQREELGNALRLNPTMLLARLELADALIALRNYTSALGILNDAPEHDRNSPYLKVAKNWALLGSGDLAQARKGVNEGLAAGRTADLLVQDGLLKLHERNTAAGRASLEEALTRNPTNLRALQALAQSYFAARQNAEGLAKVKEYAAKAPNSPGTQMFLAETLMQAGDRAAARNVALTERRNHPEYAAPALLLAQVELADGNSEAARKVLQETLAANRGVEQAALLLGNLEQKSGNYQAAIDLYRKAVAVNDRNWMSVNNLASCLTAAGEYDEALKYAQRASELNPENPSVADTLGWAFYKKGIYRSAVKVLEKLAGNKNAVHQYHLAMAHIQAGELSKAQAALENGNRLNQNVAEAKMAANLYSEASRQVHAR